MLLETQSSPASPPVAAASRGAAGFVKQAADPYAHPAHPEPPCTWEMAPKRIDWNAKAPAAQPEAESLIATYKKCKDLEHADLAGDKRGSGIINK